MAQQISEEVEKATFPHQYALSTRAGIECVGHLLQAATAGDECATVISIDGIGAFDLISRAAMLEGLARLEGGSSALPFVSLFYGEPSLYLWEDEKGHTHEIRQAEGGEQGDPVMPALFELDQHRALNAFQTQLLPGESLYTFLDEIYLIATPDCALFFYAIVEQELWRHARIRVHTGKTRVWNRAGERPPRI